MIPGTYGNLPGYNSSNTRPQRIRQCPAPLFRLLWEYPISLHGEANSFAMRPLVSFARTAATFWALLACSRAFAGSRCEQLASFATPLVEITVTAVVQSGSFTPPTGKAFGDLPPFCRVAAVLHPSSDSAIRIELWMPEANWNGRLEGTGNGGFAGNLAYGALAAGVKRGCQGRRESFPLRRSKR